jgi:hypothetical protein
LVPTRHFATIQKALLYLRNVHPEMAILAMETTERSKLYSQVDYRQYYRIADQTTTSTTTTTSGVGGIALILGNEVTGVDSSILSGTNLPWMDAVSATSMTGTMTTKELESNQVLVDEIIELRTQETH